MGKRAKCNLYSRCKIEKIPKEKKKDEFIRLENEGKQQQHEACEIGYEWNTKWK